MKIEEAIVYVLASSGHGMKTEQIAREINERGLFHRRDKAPVDGKMVYAVVMSHPDTFNHLTHVPHHFPYRCELRIPQLDCGEDGA